MEFFVKPSMDLNELQKFWHKLIRPDGRLYALLLYHRDHKELRDYIIESHDILGDLSGEEFYVIIFDDLEDPKPSTKIFSLMNNLGLNYTEIPCIAFFKSLEDDEIFTYSLQKEKPYEEQFVYIFDVVRKCFHETVDFDKFLDNVFDCVKKN